MLEAYLTVKLILACFVLAVIIIAVVAKVIEAVRFYRR